MVSSNPPPVKNSAAPSYDSSEWEDVTREIPCHSCRKADWCRRTTDGAFAICHRHNDGTAEERRDTNGQLYYLYRLRESPRGERWPEPRFSLADGNGELAGVDVRSQVYTALLSHLNLSAEHRDNLALRGFRGDPHAAGFRTFDRQRVYAARELVRQGLEHHLPRVPGFYVKEKNGARYWCVRGPAGLLVPVRDTEGKIQALLVRADDPGDGGKYVYLSSKKLGGAGPGSPVHVPLFTGDKTTVRVTEGALKADVATSISGVLTIGLPGVANWRRAAALLRKLGAMTVRVAFDADARRNSNVADSQLALVKALRAAQFQVQLETWDQVHGKGIDDLLAKGHTPHLHSGDEAVAVAEAIAAAAHGRQQTAEKKLVEIHLTDRGNALRLVRQHGADFRHVHPWAKDLVWTGQRWQVDDTAQVERFAKGTVVRMYEEAAAAPDDSIRKALVSHALKSESAGSLAAMIRLARSESGIAVLPQDLDRDPWALTCPNGTLDLRTGRLRAHQRQDLATKMCPTPFDPKAACPLWERFLVEIFASDEELIAYLQRLFGYCLTGDVSEHLFPVCWGPGGNGKGTTLETIRATMGADYSMAAMPDFLMARRGEHHPTELADLFGKRLVICQETEKGRRLNEPLMKWLTGGDRLRARRMREDAWEFSPTHKLFFVSNYKPEIRGTDTGVWRRVRLIPFTVTFEGEKKDPKMGEKLKAEAPGILAWMVRGALDWQRNGMAAPQRVMVATAEYRSDQDIIGAFLADCCLTGSEVFRTRASALYQVFRRWVQDTGETGGVAALSQTKFGTELQERGFARVKSNGWWYIGIAIREEETEQSDLPD